jgi:hypothetical protein
MAVDRSIWQWLAVALRAYVQPLAEAHDQGEDAIIALLREATGSDSGGTDIAALTAVTDAARALADADLSQLNNPNDVRNLLAGLLSSIEGLTSSLGDLAGRLFEYLSIKFAQKNISSLYSFFQMLGVIDDVKPAGQRLAWGNLSNLWHPQTIMRDVYGWGTDSFDSDRFLLQLANLAGGLGAPVTLATPQEAALALLDPPAGGTAASPPTVLLAPILQQVIDVELSADGPPQEPAEPVTVVAGFAAIPLMRGDPSDAGIALMPIVDAQFPEGSLREDWSVRFNSRWTEGYGLVFRPSGTQLGHVSSDLPAASGLEASLERKPENPWRLQLIDGLEIGLEAVALTVGIQIATTLEPTLRLAVRGFEVKVVQSGNGFLSAVLPPDGFRGRSDFTIEWSRLEGLVFTASGGFQTTIPIHRQLGPLTLTQLHLLGILGGSPTFSFEATLDLGIQIGPVHASIAGIGVRMGMAFRDSDGLGGSEDAQFGPLGLDVGFVPPRGVGLAIEAGAVAGGGFLEYAPDDHRYAGILHLNLGEIGLVAVGLITTQLPDGSNGFAMLLIIGVQFSPPVQLSFGFTLSGVGGLGGVHRTMVVDALQNGLRNRTLDSILFPEDPILNANKIISDLEGVFPAEEGRYVLGPMVKIGWGSPNIIQGDIAILIELPDPIRVVLLGQIAAAFPKPDDAVVVLNLDVLGVLEFARRSLAIDAILYDSRILTYPLSGDSAMRLTWGDNPQFALSLGGFHPRYSPPPAFPSLRRLALSLSSSSSFQLSCEVYQALSANSLQFGARIELYAEAAGASVDGALSFDALIYFSPFSFDVDIDGKVVARYKGKRLAGVHIHLSLSGPTPWHAQGRASFEILVWDVTVRFNKTWGRDTSPTLPPEDPWPHFKDALERAESWGYVLPGGRTMVEALRSTQREAAQPAGTPVPEPIMLHPAGTLEVRQKVVPLGLRLSKFGNAPITEHNAIFVDGMVAAPNRNALASNDSNALLELEVSPLNEYFARGQYEDLTDHQKLSLPSFELMPGGLAATDSILVRGTTHVADVTFESILIGADRVGTKRVGRLTWSIAARLTLSGAAGRSRMRTVGAAKFKTRGTVAKVAVTPQGHMVVRSSTLEGAQLDARVAPNDGTLSRMAADQALGAHLEQHSEDRDKLLVVQSFEVPS